MYNYLTECRLYRKTADTQALANELEIGLNFNN